jgi:hypothetical protein
MRKKVASLLVAKGPDKPNFWQKFERKVLFGRFSLVKKKRGGNEYPAIIKIKKLKS